jgi:FAD/FMN-containing dehydrogenase
MSMGVATPSGQSATLSDEAVEGLQALLRGSASPGEDEARPPFNAMGTGRAGLTVKCSGTADVVDAISFAREHGLLVGVRGGGHSVAGLSKVDGGMLIDLSPMRGVTVDPDKRIATAQGGALWADVDRETQAFGLAAPGGVVSDTGIAGLTLGGGYGWLRRKYGLSSDNLIEAQVVGADGKVRTASADSNPDLFWAIRGGGGNFGIVTSFTFRLHPVGPLVGFAATFYAIEELPSVMRRWRDFVGDVPDDITSVIVTITFPANPEMPEAVHDRAVAIVGGVHASGDPEAGVQAMQPLRELGEPLFDMSGPTPFVGVQSGFDALFPRDTMQSYWKSQYLDSLPDEAIDTLAGRAADRPAPMTLVNTFHMGGALAAVDPEATAFSERSPEFMVSIDGMWDDPASNEQNIAWVRSAWEDVKQFGTGAVYLNFTGLAEEAPEAGVDTALGRNLRRLAEIKAKYDPDNFFSLNNNIKPAS